MSQFVKINGQLFDTAHTTIAEIARQAGVTVATVRHHIQETKAKRQLEKARRELQISSAGWNPRSGPNKGLRN